MSSCTRRCSVRLASIAENSSLLPPVGVWAVLNPSVAARPLRPATDRCFGRPLPHQLANQPRTHLGASPESDFAWLPKRMRSCHRFLGGIPHLKADHPRVTHPSATPSCTKAQEDVRLACVRHAASVYPEPGSNSPFIPSSIDGVSKRPHRGELSHDGERQMPVDAISAQRNLSMTGMLLS